MLPQSLHSHSPLGQALSSPPSWLHSVINTARARALTRHNGETGQGQPWSSSQESCSRGRGREAHGPLSCSPAACGPSVQACISIITDAAGSPALLCETAQPLSGKPALPSISEEAQGSFPCASTPEWQVLCTVNGPPPCGFRGYAKYHGLCLQSLPIPTQAGSRFP